MFFFQAMNPAHVSAVDAGAVNGDPLISATGGHPVCGDMAQRGGGTASFFLALANGHFFIGFTGLDHAGDQLEQPGRALIFKGTDAELFGKHNRFAHGINQQDTNGLAPFKQLPVKGPIHSPLKRR